MSPISASSMRRDRTMGITASSLLHISLFIFGGVALIKPIEYAVEAGSGGIEISLIAAPAEPVSSNKTVVQELPKPVEEEPIVKDPENTPLPQQDAGEQKQVQTAVDSEYKGDGSSVVPGRDSTTFYSQGGAITEVSPDYLKNPAPYYPWEAREKGWQGVVILKVSIDKSGRPIKVEKEKGSGYAVLDESAVKTVKSWRFRPAQVGALPVESSVRIPVRFELENLKRG